MQFKLLSTIAEINPRLPEGNYEDDLMVSFIPMANLEAEIGIINLSLEKKYSQVRKGYTSFIDGDVIFAKITPCMENGKSGLVQKLKNGIGFGSTEFHVIRPSQQVLGKYLFYYVVQRSFRNEARKFMTGSAGQLRVPANYLKNILIPLPPLPEQQRIVARIEELFSELDNGIQNLKTAQAQLKTYRQAVLKAAFEGKLSEE
ncbi:MAG TPA: restriction endonuclease subunit S [Candidatus Cloacimonadota bacterium]|nr:restriction endonuclease subunit S [Candidatus Cloacimonadota bacterium]